MNNMTLQIAFPDQSPSFAYGVEYGRLFEKMLRGDEVVMNYGFPVRVENKSLIEETCKQYGYCAVFGKEREGWIDFTGIKKTLSEN